MTGKKCHQPSQMLLITNHKHTYLVMIRDWMIRDHKLRADLNVEQRYM